VAYPEDFDAVVPSDRGEFERLPPKAQVACCIHMLEAEVNNGGFHQFFFNSSGQYVRETLSALHDIGAVKTRRLLERAIAAAFPNSYPSNSDTHQDALADFDAIADDLEPLDSEFYRYAEPLTVLVNAYLAKDP
jgi:hypothetical protein